MSGEKMQEDISVIIQGPIVTGPSDDSKWTRRVCLSVRQCMPEAEIVLSTWEGSDVEGLDYDILVESQDPGNFVSYYNGENGEKSYNNFNRQIVSTVNGIKAATKKYVMKLRTDTILTGRRFLKYFNEYGIKEIEDGESKERILTLEPRNPFGHYKNTFCLCDFWFYGLKEDILRLWDIPLYVRPHTWKRDLLGEEYLFYNYINSLKGIPFEMLMGSRIDEDVWDCYREIMASEFIIIPTRKSGLVCLKYPRLNCFSIVCLRHYVCSFSDWKVNYDQIYRNRNYIYRIFHRLEVMSGAVVIFLKKIKEMS